MRGCYQKSVSRLDGGGPALLALRSKVKHAVPSHTHSLVTAHRAKLEGVGSSAGAGYEPMSGPMATVDKQTLCIDILVSGHMQVC